MVGRAVVSLSLCALLSGCAGWWGGARGEAVCPVITEASAWTNRQPSTDSGGPVVLVSVRFEAPSKMRLYRDDTSPPERLALELQGSDQPALPAISYRERLREPARERVVISCGGEELIRLNSIDDVY